MIVYVEIVIFNNLCIDFLLGVTTSLCRRRKVKKMRQALSAIIGCTFAVFYPFMPLAVQLIVRIGLVFLLVIVQDQYRSIKDYLASVGIFTALTFLLGGIVYGLSNIIGVDVRNYIVLGILMLSIAILEFVVWFVLKGKSQQFKSIFDVYITFKNKRIQLKGFYDTGNTLVDPLTGRPIVLLSKRAVDMLADNNQLNYDGFVDIKTVNGESTVPIIELDEICCGQSVYSCFGAILGQDMKDCDVILQNTLVYN